MPLLKIVNAVGMDDMLINVNHIHHIIHHDQSNPEAIEGAKSEIYMLQGKMACTDTVEELLEKILEIWRR